jgi:hypothetical protein
MPATKLQYSRTVVLQINTSGAWRTIVKLNLDKTDQSAHAMSHAAEIAHLFEAKLRIVSDDGTQRAISHWSDKRTGWVDVRHDKNAAR